MPCERNWNCRFSRRGGPIFPPRRADGHWNELLHDFFNRQLKPGLSVAAKGRALEFLDSCRDFLALRDLPSPPWGRGWTAAGVLFSRGGPGEGVVGLRPCVCSSHRSAESNGKQPRDVQHPLEKPRDSVVLFVVSGHSPPHPPAPLPQGGEGRV